MNSTARYRQTPKGILTNLYHKQRYRCQKKGRALPTYSLAELHAWGLQDRKFLRLCQEWLSAGCPKEKKPSIDRIDALRGYSLNNIQFMTWAENRHKENWELERIKGKATYRIAPDGTVTAYRSQREAVRDTGLPQGNISRACHEPNRTCGGYRWTYEHPELLSWKAP